MTPNNGPDIDIKAEISTKDIISLKYTSDFFPIEEKYSLNIVGSLSNGGHCNMITFVFLVGLLFFLLLF